MSDSDHSSSDHSTLSLEKSRPLLAQLPTRGTKRVKYQEELDWDFHVNAGNLPVDMSLILPHYRARNQPVNHQMSMLVANNEQPVKLKICRSMPSSKFSLEVLADTSDVTVWIPSDFKGQIHSSGRPTFSAGFVNHILANVRINEPKIDDFLYEDNIIVVTRGKICLRMWDVRTCSAENTQKECIKRIFGCSNKAPETAIDWDFLIKD